MKIEPINKRQRKRTKNNLGFMKIPTIGIILIWTAILVNVWAISKLNESISNEGMIFKEIKTIETEPCECPEVIHIYETISDAGTTTIEIIKSTHN